MVKTSISMRTSDSFLRTSFISSPSWGIPLIENQQIQLPERLDLVAFSAITSRSTKEDWIRGVHFFIDDYRFERVYRTPDRYLERLKQFLFVLSPDFSIYAEMPRWLQLAAVAKNRWCGSFWQSHGVKVIPTISWGLPDTYDFCFDGVEPGGIVAVSTLGCCKAKRMFMRGYDRMLEVLTPSKVICFSRPFPEMQGNVLPVDYNNSMRGKKNGR